MTPTIQWQSAMQTHTGNVRPYNEDACLIRKNAALWAVADGMGGHEAGDIASQLIVQKLQQIPAADHLNDFIHHIKKGLIATNHKLRVLAQKKYANRTIGSTVVTMIADNHFVAYLWAGDSRLYRIRDQQIKQLTTDHSETQRLIDQGILSPQNAKNHPSANIITRAIGATNNLQLSVGIEKIEHNDIYILCSDGLYRDITENEIVALCQQKTVDEISEKLMRLALSREAKDNITIVISKCAWRTEK